ncbi:MAG: DUF1015 family protein [Chitinophagales bacterium]
MITIKPFKGWRPGRDIIGKVAAPPYDVLSSDEAREMAKGNDISFLRITKPEVDFDASVNIYSKEVYQKGKTNWNQFKADKVFVQDESPKIYFYRQSINGHSQTGIVAASAIDDYFNNKIKKHEYTRPQKENDRIEHMFTLGIHPGPVFLTYKSHDLLDRLVAEHTQRNSPEYDFLADDGVQHTLWLVEDEKEIATVVHTFKNEIEATYIADGHHRAAASSKVGLKLREENGDKDGAHNYFLSVLFPDNQLKIIDYNRLIIDLNDQTEEEFLKAIEAGFEVEKIGNEIYKPKQAMEFGMYINKNWYKLVARPHTFDANDPIKCLDVTILSDHLIDPILGIKDQRTDDRIDFVGGIRGLGELKKRVDSGEMVVAFALFPVSIQQLIDIADAGMVMPPKSTWFEPKLRSGLVVHEFVK